MNISGSTYNWTYTTPFNLTPGATPFAVRSTDDLGPHDVDDQPGPADHQCAVRR